MTKKIALIFVFCFSFFVSAQKNDTLKNLLIELKNQKIDSSKISINLELGKRYFIVNSDSSFFYLNEALNLSKQQGLKKYEAEALFELAVNFELTYKYSLATEKYKESLHLYEELSDKPNIALIYNSLGFNYTNLFSENKALESYLKSLNIYKEINDKKGIALNLNGIGNLYYDFENYKSANIYFNNALKIYKTLGDKEGLSATYTNIGKSISDNGNYKEGLTFYNKSIKYQIELDGQPGLAANYNNIGYCFIQLKQYSKANNYFTKALEIAEKENDKEYLALIYLNMAEVQNKLNYYNNAIYYAKLSNKIAQKIGKLDFIVNNFKQLSESYELAGDQKKSHFFYKKYIKLKDSLSEKDKQKKVLFFNALTNLEKQNSKILTLEDENAVTQLKYKNEKKLTYLLIISILISAIFVIIMIFQQIAKNKALKSLKLKNHQIKKLNDEMQLQKKDLELLNNTKDKFFSIIAHDLKNPLNSIQGFAELLIDNLEIYPKKKSKNFLTIIKESTHRASNLLSDLLIWANAQTGNLEYKPEKIELIKHVSDVISLVEIQTINKNITIFNSVYHNLFVLADKNMLNTILRNLISNAIKFSNQGSEIYITSSCDAHFITITIRDEGVGMDESTLEKLFNIEHKNSTVGTANEEGSGLGLILCKDFIEKNGGKIWVESNLGEGSSFNFTIPIYKETQLTN